MVTSEGEEADVYAVGQSLEGQWLGVATKLIET
jgi:hypothetical protein